jgi:type I restriction enzyme M protein
MDASQYKDYVLVLLPPLTIPPGASFRDMVALKGSTDIGDQINKKIIAPLAKANQQLSQADFPDFNDANKLGSGKEQVERLTNLIAIFENGADGDDILGDASELPLFHRSKWNRTPLLEWSKCPQYNNAISLNQ